MRALAACRSHFMLWHVYGQPTPPPSFSWIIGIRGCAKPSPARPLTPAPPPKLYKPSTIDTDFFTLAAKIDCRCFAYLFWPRKAHFDNFFIFMLINFLVHTYRYFDLEFVLLMKILKKHSGFFFKIVEMFSTALSAQTQQRYKINLTSYINWDI